MHCHRDTEITVSHLRGVQSSTVTITLRTFRQARHSLMKAYKLLAKAVVAAEMALFPLLFVAFLFSGAIASTADAMGADFGSPPSLWFLNGQYSFFNHRELISPRVIIALHLLALFAYLSITVAALRLITGPAGFSMVDVPAITAKRKLSVPKLIAGWLLIGVFGIPSSLDIQGMSDIYILKPIIFSAPVFFIGFETFVFVFATVVFVEGLLICIQFFYARA